MFSTLLLSDTWMAEWCPGWICLELRRQQWTGNSGCPLFGGKLDLSHLCFRRLVCSADRDPAVAVLCGCIAFDHPLRIKVNKAPPVIITGDGGLRRQNRLLAVRAEHFCQIRKRILPELDEFVFTPQTSA